MTLHKEIIGANIHVIFNWSYADATARLAATGFVAADVGKVSYQASDSSLWLLTDDSPIVWAAVAGSTYTNEEAQDAVGTILADSTSINFTYTDATPEITAAAIFGSGAGTVAEGNHTHAQLHDAATVTDTASINLTLAGQDITAAAIFGSTTGTVAEGDHTHAGGYTDEQAQDAVGTILVDSASINFTYTDATPDITAVAIFGSAAGTVTQGDDARLSDARTPTAHTHPLAEVSDVTASAAEVNLLDGVTASTAELNILDGVTATAAELNALDGITATVSELNFTDGVTSAIQGQIDGKQPLDSDLTTIAGLTATTDNVIQSVASAWASRTPAQLKATLALVKGDVGLGNVDNTSDAAKPVSTATQTALDLKADDSAVVHDTGNETIAGIKTFSSDPLIPDEVYGVGWNGSLEPPTKNAVYDKIETMVAPVTNTATLDFGTDPLSDQSFTVTDAAIATTSKIIASISSFTGFARSMDEVYADPISFSCEPLAGSMTVRAQAFAGRVTGTYPIVYSIA